MKKLRYIKIFTIIMAGLLIGSCKKSILDYPDPNSKSVNDFFKTPDEIQQGSIAIYSALYTNSAYAWQLPEMFDGLANEYDGRPSSAGETDIQSILRYQHNATTGPIGSFWRLLYRVILRSNLVIEKGGEYVTANGDDPVVSKSMGDAYFLRGWAYMQLAFYWGDVPLRTTYTIEGNGDASRTPVDQIWAQAESDLKEAQNRLPDAWDPAFLGRATKGAATGFLGKLYLDNQKYPEADAEFAKLDGKYSLLPGNQWDDNFGETNKNNQESVFQIQFNHYPGADQFGTMFDPEEPGNPSRANLHAQLYSWSDWSNWAFQPRRVADFQYNDESGNPYVDPRAALTFYGGTIGDQTFCDKCASGPEPFDFAKNGYWYRKSTNKENKPSENGGQSSNNINLMRYADVLLMRAECQIKQSNVSAGLGYINQVRTRIGAFPYVASYTADQAFDLLKRERQLELMGEQSRFNDLKRWGILVETMNIEMQAMFGTQNVEQKHYLFPIPQLEIDTNKGLGTVSNDWN